MPYLRNFHRVEWNDPLLYHLMLNTGFLSHTEAMRLILHAASPVDTGDAAGDSGDTREEGRPAMEWAGAQERPHRPRET